MDSAYQVLSKKYSVLISFSVFCFLKSHFCVFLCALHFRSSQKLQVSKILANQHVNFLMKPPQITTLKIFYFFLLRIVTTPFKISKRISYLYIVEIKIFFEWTIKNWNGEFAHEARNKDPQFIHKDPAYMVIIQIDYVKANQGCNVRGGTHIIKDNLLTICWEFSIWNFNLWEQYRYRKLVLKMKTTWSLYCDSAFAPKHFCYSVAWSYLYQELSPIPTDLPLEWRAGFWSSIFT